MACGRHDAGFAQVVDLVQHVPVIDEMGEPELLANRVLVLTAADEVPLARRHLVVA